MFADSSLYGSLRLWFFHAGGGTCCSSRLQRARGRAAHSQLPTWGRQDVGGCSSLLLLSPCFSQWTWYFSASPNSSSVVRVQHKNTLILGCFLWVSCSGGENQTNYQQFSSSANHSPAKKFYWTQQFRNTAWIQSVKVLLLSPYFLGLAKNMSSFLSKTGGWGGGREGGLINTLRQAVQRLGLQSPSFITFFALLITGRQSVAQVEHLKIYLFYTIYLLYFPLSLANVLPS